MARVLIVNDDKEIADSQADLLKPWGHDTRKVYDGESVVQQALAFVPHVVMIDIDLPKIDGYAVAHRLRQYQQLAGLKIIAVTGHATAADAQRGAGAGFDLQLVKPIEVGLLKDYLADL